MNNGDSGFFNAYVGVTSSKTAAVRSEDVGAVLPHNLLGAPGAAVLAGLKRTRTNKEQISADKDRWKNILIPGRAMYNKFKRTGVAEREWDKMTEEQRRAVIADVVSVDRDKEDEETERLVSEMNPRDAEKYRRARGVLRDLKQDWEHLTLPERKILRGLLLTQAGHIEGKGKSRTGPKLDAWVSAERVGKLKKDKVKLKAKRKSDRKKGVGFWQRRKEHERGKARLEEEYWNEWLDIDKHIPNVDLGTRIMSPEEDEASRHYWAADQRLGIDRAKERDLRIRKVTEGDTGKKPLPTRSPRGSKVMKGPGSPSFRRLSSKI
jgi:hypothetical protein